MREFVINNTPERSLMVASGKQWYAMSTIGSLETSGQDLNSCRKSISAFTY